ncbi:hypothetical protein [Methylocystis echinoides]|uniref:hypothetical protein n=1 Tax=Methylocystis echinoides TaxID=29468 RepID=UPI00342A7CFA
MTKRQLPIIYDEDEFASPSQILNSLYSFGHLENVESPECAPWLEMCIAVDIGRDFQPLLELLQSGRQVPAAAMPYVRDLFERHGLISGVRGDKRRTPLYELTYKEVSLLLACDEVKELVEDGMNADEAIDLVAKQRDLSAETMTAAYKGKLGAMQRMRARLKRRKMSS